MKYSAAEMLLLGLPPSVIVAVTVGGVLAELGVITGVEVAGFPASVNVVCAVRPEVWPVAVSWSVAPNSSSSNGTPHVVEILPASSAATVQGWWAGLVSV